ncbi:MAG: response regulator transcription factor [Pseudomonadota bacterium]
MQKILIIDDDARLVENVQMYLKDFGYLIEAAFNGMDGLEKVRAFQPDLVILDLMMPKINGLEVCREIRRESIIPIIMLTARGEESDVVAGLEVGADDYLTKPFSLRELAARIKARLRHTAKSESTSDQKKAVLVCGELTIDYAKREVYKTLGKEQTIISLTSTEFNLLWFMASQPGVVFDRDKLLDELRNRELEPFDRSIDAHISHLRKKIEDAPKNPRYIITVWGAGYKFQDS